MKNQIGFKIIGLKTEQFAIIEQDYKKTENFEIITDLEFKTDNSQNLIGVFALFTFKADEKPFIILQISCHFAIAPESWEQCQEKSKIIFPKDFMTHITIMTVGCARGILHSKTEGTEFNKFILPMIDVTKLVTQDIEFNYV